MYRDVRAYCGQAKISQLSAFLRFDCFLLKAKNYLPSGKEIKLSQISKYSASDNKNFWNEIKSPTFSKHAMPVD